VTVIVCDPASQRAVDGLMLVPVPPEMLTVKVAWVAELSIVHLTVKVVEEA
jgi:hypothetical protein